MCNFYKYKWSCKSLKKHVEWINIFYIWTISYTYRSDKFIWRKLRANKLAAVFYSGKRNKSSFFLVLFVFWKIYISSGGRNNVPSRVLYMLTLSRDGTFLRAELRWNVLTRRAEIGRSYAPSGDRTLLLPPDDMTLSEGWFTFGYI